MKIEKATYKPIKGKYSSLSDKKNEDYNSLFIKTQKNILATLESLETKSLGCNVYGKIKAGKAYYKNWLKKDWYDQKNHINKGGGGRSGILKGRVFEKAGVNYSNVSGIFPKELRKQIPGAIESNGEYKASGVSVIIHPRSPHLPAIHMNIRTISTSFSWVGGVIDLNPMGLFDEKLAQSFYDKLKDICEEFQIGSYKPLAKACDKYFFIHHRNRSRGIGGVFFDYLPTEPNPYELLNNIGKVFCSYYSWLSEKLYKKEWQESDVETQQIYRGYYAEFNLVYDRGTKFGFLTKGNTESILMSLPPKVSWPAPEAEI